MIPIKPIPNPQLPKPRAQNRICLNCMFFVSVDPKQHMGRCDWVPPPIIQDMINTRFAVCPETFTCDAWEAIT